MMIKILAWVRKFIARFSFVGLLLGSILFAFSLSPSLIPRTPLFQGILAGLSFALGYGTGILIRWVWRYMEIPEIGENALRWFRRGTSVIALILLLTYLWQSTGWQNDTRALVGMDPLESGNIFKVAVIGLATGLVLIFISFWVGRLIIGMNHYLGRFIPRRIANVVGTIIVAVFLVNIVNGAIVKGALASIDKTFQLLDRSSDDGIDQPTLDIVAGGKSSLISWETLGRQGRRFVSIGPSQAKIANFTRKPAKQPIRVYVGLNSAKTVEQRAQLALDELIRVGAFERKVLVVATPTGTGWIESASAVPLEYLHHGDTAFVTMQYSYLESYLSLLVEPGFAKKSAQALFNSVYGHWTKLPKDARPNLYLYGLSLGSHGSEASSNLFTLFADPIQGAVWAGPPFANELWRDITEHRNPGSPAWLPSVGDGSLVRFMNRDRLADATNAPWGPMRILYLQHASDPIVFFDMKAAFQKPAWMEGEHGPDVSQRFRWFPIVTFVQLLLDMPVASSVPMGHGHNYTADAYIRAWQQVSDPQGWSAEDIDRLHAEFADMKKGA